MSQINEIAPDFYRISTFVPEANLQFNQFLVRDRAAVVVSYRHERAVSGRAGRGRHVNPIHPRSDGSASAISRPTNAARSTEWQTLAPEATAVCSFVGKMVSVDDVVARRPAQALADGEVLSTGKYRFRMLLTPHVPHCWEASLLFEETQGTLFCSDLLHQNGDVEPSTSADVVGRFKQTLVDYQQGPLANYMPYTPYTESTLQRLARSSPKLWPRCTGRRSSATALKR